VIRRAIVILALSVVLAACSGGGDSGDPTASSTVQPTANRGPSVTATATVSPDGERVVLEWRREGGIAGFCDGMTVAANHRATLGTCEDPRAAVIGQLLPMDWIGQVEGWRDRFASFEWEQANLAGTADGMTVTLRLEGRGTSEASEAEQREMAKLAAELFVVLQREQRRVGIR
jgi:hypothetical protein